LGGIIDQVTFYDGPYVAVANLVKYVKDMNPEKNGAVVYGPDGLIANSKLFLDKNDQYTGSVQENKSIYIIANPCHSLGFLVISPKEPVGYTDPIAAVAVLREMQKEHGAHIRLYRVEPCKCICDLRGNKN